MKEVGNSRVPIGRYKELITCILVLVLIITSSLVVEASSITERIKDDVESLLRRERGMPVELTDIGTPELDENLLKIKSLLDDGETNYTWVESYDKDYLTDYVMRGKESENKMISEMSKISDLEKYIRENYKQSNNKGIRFYGYSASGALDLLTNMYKNRVYKLESYYDGKAFKYNDEVCELLNTLNVYKGLNGYEYKPYIQQSFEYLRRNSEYIEGAVLDTINSLDVNEGVYKDLDFYMMPREVEGLHGLAHPNIRSGYGGSRVFVMGRSSYYPLSSTIFTSVHELGHIYHYQVDNIDSVDDTTVGLDMSSRINSGMRSIYPSYGSKGLNTSWAESPREKFADDFAVYHMKRLGHGDYNVRVKEPYSDKFAGLYRRLLNDSSISEKIGRELVSNDVILEYKGVEIKRANDDIYFPTELLYSGNTVVRMDMSGLAADRVTTRYRSNVRQLAGGEGTIRETSERLGSDIYIKDGRYISIDVPRLTGVSTNSDLVLSRTPSGRRYFMGSYIRGRSEFPSER